MSFRRRTVLLAAGAVAAAVVLASVVVYVVTRDDLRGQLDARLRQKLAPGQPQAVRIETEVNASALKRLKREGKLPPALAPVAASAARDGLIVANSPLGPDGRSSGASKHAAAAASLQRRVLIARGVAAGQLPPPVALGAVPRLVLPVQKLGGAQGYVQLFQSNGNILRSERRGLLLPITAATRAVAAGRRDAFFSDATVAGTRVRILTERAHGGGVWQVALPLTDLDSSLTHLKLVLALVSLGGIALAAAFGLLVSRAALVPVRRLTSAAERVTRTQDLGHRIEERGRDELGRLAASFNTMLAALERSRLAQRQLISDASHELRTPLTSVQANLDALALGDRLPPRARARILDVAKAQLRELTALVGDLVDLSKTEVDQVEVEDVRLDLAAAAALERARLHAPDCRFTLLAEPCLVRAAPARLDRAIANLLDNAVKWGPPAGPVELRVAGGALRVRDHGPGIAVDDLPRVFDRFYRAPGARGRPGSGLGLAIVRQMAEAHGGAVHATNDPGGGAILTLELPPLAMTDSEREAAELDAAQRELASPPLRRVQQVPRLL
jgi:two-component system, OmpR family, sensor histidine kinase MprB